MSRKGKYIHRSEFLKPHPANCQAVHCIDLVLLKKLNSQISNEPICWLLPASDCQLQGLGEPGHTRCRGRYWSGAVCFLPALSPVEAVDPILVKFGHAAQSAAQQVGKNAGAGRQASGPLDRLLPICDNQPRIRLTMVCPALRPAPMARMTVAEPVTMSPPAKTPGMEVSPVSSLISI